MKFNPTIDVKGDCQRKGGRKCKKLIGKSAGLSVVEIDVGGINSGDARRY
jgi:hypothetical protein